MIRAVKISKSYIRQLRRIQWLRAKEDIDILIVDHGIEDVRKCIPKSLTTFYVPIRGERWFVNIAIVLNFLKYYYRFGRSAALSKRGCYIASLGKYLQAKVIVTMIDNNNWDAGLNENVGLRVINIQNGFRGLNEIEGKSFDIYCTLQRIDDSQLRLFNIRANSVVPCGSLRLGLFAVEHAPRRRSDSEFVEIVYPSQYRPYVVENDIEVTSSLMRCQKSICQLIQRFAQETNLPVRVALSASKPGDWERQEESFYREIFGDRVEFSRRSSDRWASYKAISSAKIVVGMGSTLLLESIGMGKRTVFCFPGCDPNIAGWYFKGLNRDILKMFSVNKLVYAEFSEKLQQLLKMGEAELSESIEVVRQHVCNYQENDLPQQQIESLVEATVAGVHC